MNWSVYTIQINLGINICDRTVNKNQVIKYCKSGNCKYQLVSEVSLWFSGNTMLN